MKETQNNRLKTRSGKDIHQIGYGLTSIVQSPIPSAFYSDAPSKEKAIEFLQKAIEMGYNLFDVARLYGDESSDSHSESILGQAIKNREDVFISTKGGFYYDDKEQDANKKFKIGSPDEVRSDLEKSLKRLNTNYVDVYYWHRVDPNSPDFEKGIIELGKLREEGKTRYVGVSDVDGKTIEKIDAILKKHFEQGLDFIQNEYSITFRGCERKTDNQNVDYNGVFEACKEFNIIMMAYCPVTRGLLSADATLEKFSELPETDVRRYLPVFQKDNLQININQLQFIKKMAENKHVTVTQLALAWILEQGRSKQITVIPIPGTKNPEHLKGNYSAVQISLSYEERKDINEHYPKNKFKGSRWFGILEEKTAEESEEKAEGKMEKMFFETHKKTPQSKMISRTLQNNSEEEDCSEEFESGRELSR